MPGDDYLNDEEKNALNDERNPARAHYEQQLGNEGVEGGEKSLGQSLGIPDGRAAAGISLGDKSGQAESQQTGSNKQPRGGIGKLLASREKGLTKLAGVLQNKWFIGAGIGGGGIFFLIIILLVMLAAFKVPHVTENIAAYRFERVMTRQAFQNDRTLKTKIAIDAADDTMYGRMKSTFANGTGKVSEQWSKLDKYRPNKQIANLNEEGLKFNYSGRRLVGITINDKTLLTPKSNFIKDRIPGYKFTQGIKISQQFTPELNKALDARDIGPYTRGIINSKLRQQLGVGWVAWKIGQYKGKTDEQVRVAEEKANAQVVETKDTAAPKSQALADDVDKVEQAEDNTLQSDDKIKATIANDGVSPDVEAVVDNAGKQSGFQQALGFLNGAYAVAVPLCIIYDGSVTNSGSSSDARSAAATKAWMRLQTVADETKDGNAADVNAVRSYADKLGDTNDSPLSERFRGAKYANTEGYATPQSGDDGSFTLFNAAFGSSTLVDVASTGAEKGCGALTNTTFAVGVGLAGLAAAFFTGGTSAEATTAVGQAARVEVSHLAEDQIAKFSVRAGLKHVGTQITGGQRLKVFFGKELAKGAAIGGLTFLAKQYVVNHSGQNNTGLEQGIDYQTEVDAGGDLNAQYISQHYQFGRPLTKDEVTQATANTYEALADANASKSTYQRYLAISNPDSLLTNVGMTFSASLSRSSLIKFASSAGSLLNLGKIGSQLVGAFSPAADAATATGDSNYHIVQWGWTNQELAYIKNHDDYEMLENQRILDSSGQEDKIIEDYGKCYGIDGTTIGTLLANGDIVRDDDGNVIYDQGDCSPKNLSIDNPTYGDLVFRWRVANADNNDLDEKNYEQVVTGDATNTETPAEGGDIKVASYNMCQEDNHNCPQKDDKSTLISNFITDKGIDIIAAQELSVENQAKVMSKLSTYKSFPTTVPKDQGRAVIWNSARFDMAQSGRVGNIFSNDGSYISSDSDPRAFPWVQLTDKGNGNQAVYVLSIHSPNDHSGGSYAKRQTNANAIIKWARPLVDGGATVLVMGDFNRSGTTDDGQTSAYCLMTGSGPLQHAYDLSTSQNPKKECPTKDANTIGIDQIYVSNGIGLKASNWTNFQNSSVTGTDHGPSTAVITPVASEPTSGSDTGWQWPLTENEWRGPFGYNIWGNKYCGASCGLHAGIDMSGTGGDPVLAAHDGTVVSVDSSSSCKVSVLIQATGTPYWYAYQHLGSASVTQGSTVKAGVTKIGNVYNGASTSCIQGVHLHLSVEKTAHISEYADGASITCDISVVSCAEQMTSLPPLCFLDKGDRDYGSSVSNNQIKGSDYCNQLLGNTGQTVGT